MDFQYNNNNNEIFRSNKQNPTQPRTHDQDNLRTPFT